MPQGMDDFDLENPEYDAREDDDLRGSDENRSMDSAQAEAMEKLGELEDEDKEADIVGDLMEITHDGKVTKEVLEVGEGPRLKMGYKALIKYRAYFFKDHVIFDQTEGDEKYELCLGDHSTPDGLQTGVEKMRVGEKSKIRIKKKHGFGREPKVDMDGKALKVDELVFPKGCTDEESPLRKRLLSEIIIYEVELCGFIERHDIENAGIFFKYFVTKQAKHEWETPSDRDELKFNIEIVQETKTLWKKEDWDTNMLDPEISGSIKRIISSFKRGEESIVEVKASFVPEFD